MSIIVHFATNFDWKVKISRSSTSDVCGKNRRRKKALKLDNREEEAPYYQCYKTSI